MSLINTNDIDYTKNPIFFGKGLALQRYDQFKYKKIFNNYKSQLGFFWRPEEISLSGKERTDFNNLTTSERSIFLNNLSFQILLDSCQSRGIKSLLECCTNPELEASMLWWQAFEQLHSYSYTYIVKDLLPDATSYFDDILHNPEIKARAESVTKYYNDFIDGLSTDTLEEKKRKLYLTLVSVNILEGIRFYVSFACSFAFAETGRLEGNAKILSLINRDENLHLGLTQYLIKILRTVEDEGFLTITKDCESLVYQMFTDAANEEIAWAKYLFKDGSVLGLNDEILIKYMKWLTNKRLRAIGLKHIFDNTVNPINWINNWTNSGAVQVAPQETEITSYIIGGSKNDIDQVNFDQFKI